MKREQVVEFIREENNIKDMDISYRGGVLKYDIAPLFSDKSIEAIREAGEDTFAGASQNYLGGGIAGRITSGRCFDLNLLTKKDYKTYLIFSEEVERYFWDINNGGGDEYMQEEVNSFEQNKTLPVSGY